MTGLNSDIKGLNMASQPSDDFAESLDSDLALFTNSSFYDFDMPDPASLGQPSTFNALAQDAAGGVVQNNSPLDFSADFQFADINALPVLPHDSSFSDQQTFANSQYPPSTFASPPTTDSATIPPTKRPRSDSIPQSQGSPSASTNLDAASREAAEEDKRRRNTAASARFRVKKKQREQAMEQKATDMEKKVTNLETKVRELERDNTLLKNLLTERGDKYDMNELRKKGERQTSTPESQ